MRREVPKLADVPANTRRVHSHDAAGHQLELPFIAYRETPRTQVSDPTTFLIFGREHKAPTDEPRRSSGARTQRVNSIASLNPFGAVSHHQRMLAERRMSAIGR